MNKCIGCGTFLNDDKKYCERCFKIKNYNYHDEKVVISDEEILENLNNKKECKLFLCDIISLDENVINLYNKINGKKYFIITKSDIIPKTIETSNIKNNLMKKYNINPLFISIKSGIGKKDVMSLIREEGKVIFCGPTSSGKSSLINYLFSLDLTTSSYTNTTLEFNKLYIDDLTIIDAPGFKNVGYNEKVKKLFSKTISLKKGYVLYLNDYAFSFDKDVNIALFLIGDVNIVTKKGSLESFSEIDTQDIMLPFGFIYVKDKAKVYYNKTINLRLSLVGGPHE